MRTAVRNVACITAGALALGACERGGSGPDQRDFAGFLYTSTNNSAGNAIIALGRAADGRLAELPGWRATSATAAALLLAATDGAQPRASRSGTFAPLDGHQGRGSVRLHHAGGTATLTLGRDFVSERGPNVDLYLSKKPNYRNRQVIRVGDLRRARGAQAYDVRAPRDLAEYRYVIAWCHTFDVGIVRAALVPAGDPPRRAPSGAPLPAERRP